MFCDSSRAIVNRIIVVTIWISLLVTYAWSGETITQGHGSLPPQGLNFAPVVTYDAGGAQTDSVAIADLNGDGKPDLVVANFSSNTVGVLLGNGDGTFKPAMTYDTLGYNVNSVVVADVNRDGKPDLILAGCQLDSGICSFSSNGVVIVLLGNGDGTFQPAVSYDSGGIAPSYAAVADVNGDGKPDVLVAAFINTGFSGVGVVSVLLGNGDGTFKAAVTYGTDNFCGVSSLAVADVNQDGKFDVVEVGGGSSDSCSSDGISVLLGNGDGTFRLVSGYSGGTDTYSVAVADINGDGKPDMVVGGDINSPCCGFSAYVFVFLGNGDGTFNLENSYELVTDSSTSVAIADVNGDGKPDIVASNSICSLTSGGCAAVFLGKGDGTFQPYVTYNSGGFGAQSVAVTDVNGDGEPDIAVANNCPTSPCGQEDGTVGVLINTSTFSKQPTSTALTSSPDPSLPGQSVTFTATVTPHTSGTPTGSVSFYDAGMNLGNSNLNTSGVATLMISTLASGTHSITATYDGDTNFLSSTSPLLYQTVKGTGIGLSPNDLNFGNQTVGIASLPQNITVTNIGSLNLMISSIQISGINMSDFSQTNNCPASIPPNGTCNISVIFSPTQAGSRNAAVSITDNAPGSPQSVSLTGVGILAGVMFSPTSLTFATQVVYTNSPPQKLLLTNNGAGILKIKSGQISAQFSLFTNCGSTLASGASCTAEVRFKPTAKGPVNGSISLTDNAPGSAQEVPLSGIGTFVQLSPTSLNFGTQPVNTTSPPQSVTLENKGNETLNFTGTGIHIGGSDPTDFAQTNNCGTSLASGAYCTITVTFTPTQQNKRTADVVVSDDGGGSPQLVPLVGLGTP